MPIPLAQAATPWVEANHWQRLVWSMTLRMESGGRATSRSITRAAIRPPFGGLSHVLRYLSRYTHRALAGLGVPAKVGSEVLRPKVQPCRTLPTPVD